MGAGVTVQWATVGAVESGEPRQVWCDGCSTSARTDVELYGLVETGLVTLGVWSQCERCDGGDGVWRCAFCPAVLPMDSTVPPGHLYEAHATPR